jgi:F420-dependent oxidoreductase-like protein
MWSMSMRFGIKTPPQHTTWQAMQDVWLVADEVDTFESAWTFDHFYPLIGDTHGPCMESWVTLTALAMTTQRLRIGCMVNGVPYRHPAVVANMAASLDIVSEGRLDLGLGAGWNEQEADAYGISLGPMKTRMDRFDEAVEVIVRLLSQTETDFSGEHYQLTAARCEPKAPPRPHPPIVIGAKGERRSLRTAARWAQHWNLSFATPEMFRHKHEVLLGHCEAVGRNPEEILCSVQLALPADEVPGVSAERAAALGEVGCDKVIFSLRPPYRAEIVEPLGKALSELT